MPEITERKVDPDQMATSAKTHDRGIETGPLTQDELDEKPWCVRIMKESPASEPCAEQHRKYVGYKEFAKFVSSSDDFFVVRKFERLHSRILLRLQDRLCELEEELDLLDKSWSEGAENIDNGTVRADRRERKELLDRIYPALGQYDDLLCRYLQLKVTPEAPQLNVRNIKTWLSNMNHPIEPKEVAFLNQKDLISAAKFRKSSAQQGFEQKILLPLVRVTRKVRHYIRRPEPIHCTITQIDEESVEILATIGIFATAGIMLIAPLWILAAVGGTSQKLAVITVFLLVFLIVLNWGISARPFETLAATAGYSAVLVVFLQLGVPGAAV